MLHYVVQLHLGVASWWAIQHQLDVTYNVTMASYRVGSQTLVNGSIVESQSSILLLQVNSCPLRYLHRKWTNKQMTMMMNYWFDTKKNIQTTFERGKTVSFRVSPNSPFTARYRLNWRGTICEEWQTVQLFFDFRFHFIFTFWRELLRLLHSEIFKINYYHYTVSFTCNVSAENKK